MVKAGVPAEILNLLKLTLEDMEAGSVFGQRQPLISLMVYMAPGLFQALARWLIRTCKES